MVEAARLYYEQELTQAQVAKRLGTSRSTVSRLLRDARASGIVRISLDYRWARSTSLEAGIRANFPLGDVRVLQNPGYAGSDALDGMGRLAASYLEHEIHEGIILGVSYGHSIGATIRHMRPPGNVSLTVVQIIGALGSVNPLIEGADLTRQLAQAYGAHYRYLHAPLMVESEQARDVILQEPIVQETLEMGRTADVVLIGIGTPASVNFWSGYLSRYDLSKLSSMGAVGHMCAEFFDEDGKILDIALNRRTISIGLSTLTRIKKVVAVAGGPEKAEAIVGALRGGFVDVLITEELAAKRVIELASGH